MMMMFVWVLAAIGLVLSVIEVGIMINALVNYIKDKMWEKQVKKEMLKKYKKV